MPIIEYKCKRCFRTFHNINDAIACEKNHAKIKAARIEQYMLINKYPLSVEIEFNDGHKELYIMENQT